MAEHRFRTPEPVNHDEQRKEAERRWSLLQTAYEEVGRVELVVEQTHGLLLESNIYQAAPAAHDQIDALLCACVALVRQLSRQMAVECDPEAAGR